MRIAEISYAGTVSTTELIDTKVKDILLSVDTQINKVMLNALMHGIHTGIVAVTLWTAATRGSNQNYRRPRRIFIFIVLALYFLATCNLYGGWAENVLYFSTSGKCLWEGYKSKCTQGTPTLLTVGISAILSTVLADVTLIWRCWIVWGRTWSIVLVPIACTTLAIITRGIITYYSSFGPVENMSPRAQHLEHLQKTGVNWAVLYSSSVLATLLWCTIFIVYRILRISGIAAGMRVYHRLVEMLVESAALYSAVIVVLLVFEVRSDAAEIYVEEFAISMRGIVPTILVGRIAAGHARPDDSWSESSSIASIQFRSSLSSQSDSGDTSAGSELDLSRRVTLDLELGLEDTADTTGSTGLGQQETSDLPLNVPITDGNFL
ncbi:hypothetical protein EDD18DRAFT_847181 [Armillaria luteobubalina]|uniref:Uncharacterized protein n=1 Tax=Armillaria luteobubalina TaxID=153913 RepID=A0AA39P889_9AGAR|nr:hypothetical protein EDD18DRAFT_847181 [Armillaria luteobubalina]